MREFIKRLFTRRAPVHNLQPVEKKELKKRRKISSLAMGWAATRPGQDDAPKRVFNAPTLLPGVVPANAKADGDYMALDSAPMAAIYDYANAIGDGIGFPGYTYLAQLTARSEYRSPSETIAKEMTRKWIKVKAIDDSAGDLSAKIAKIEAELKRHNVRAIFRDAAQQDGFFGRAQIYIDVKSGNDETRKLPLVIASATIKKGDLIGFKNIEAMWTTPYNYNSDNPLAQDFYKPRSWFVLGKQTHASRLLTMISRPVPDLFKPAYNFGGQSLSQLMEPYVNAWLRTRDSVNDLLHNFSITGLRTDMSSVMNEESGEDLFNRVDLFNQTRDNRGLMILQNGDPATGDGEEFFQLNTPLSGLDKLQAQAQEHMAAPSHIPLVKLLGITPTGLNASSDGEIRVFYDYIHAMQEDIFRDPLKTVVDVIQLDQFGAIDPAIGFEFEPLHELDGTDLAAVRKSDADTAGVLIAAGVISVEEERQRLASDPNSGYATLDVNDMPETPDDNANEDDDE